MTLYKLLHLFFGEYVFEIERSNATRFTSLILQNKLHVWGQEIDGERATFHTSLFYAERLLRLANASDVPILSERRIGLPFVFSRYSRRAGMFLGLLVFLFNIFVSQLFVWKIEINGNEAVPDSEILHKLSEIGITVGCFIPDIDVSYHANELLMCCKGLSSAAISINGTHISVTVLERKQIPTPIDESGFYNVVATHDGVILDIDAADGKPEVREGDVVCANDLLINCFLEGKNGSVRATHARGRVYAAVNESYTATIPLKRRTKVYTGNSETHTVYRVLGKEISLFGDGAPSYEYFDAITTEHRVRLLGFIELPIDVIKIRVEEYTVSFSDIDAKEAEALASGEINAWLKGLGDEVLECVTFFDENKDGTCTLKADAVVKRNIAKEIPLELINYNISERFPIARE